MGLVSSALFRMLLNLQESAIGRIQNGFDRQVFLPWRKFRKGKLYQIK